MEQGKRHDNLWSVVLAGGDGVRTKEFIRRWLGHDKPKQYCTFLGNRSMFQHTLDRAVMLTPWERMVVIAARHHQHELWAQLDGRPAGMIVLQPSNADTAAGVFLPLSHILANDPDATVVIYPSDHFIRPSQSFISVVDEAVRGSMVLGGRPVLLAAKPDSVELEYGWIQPGRFLDCPGTSAIRSVERFVEKPTEAVARRASVGGSLWNTMILAVKGRELWSLGKKCVPEIMTLFERYKEVIDTADEMMVLDAIYDSMPRRNFSKHLLERVPERLAVMEMRDVHWSDWGSPKRIAASLETIGKRPRILKDPMPFLYVG
jgi:mannose-1-phosphate guanylyltransferase